MGLDTFGRLGSIEKFRSPKRFGLFEGCVSSGEISSVTLMSESGIASVDSVSGKSRTALASCGCCCDCCGVSGCGNGSPMHHTSKRPSCDADSSHPRLFANSPPLPTMASASEQAGCCTSAAEAASPGPHPAPALSLSSGGGGGTDGPWSLRVVLAGLCACRRAAGRGSTSDGGNQERLCTSALQSCFTDSSTCKGVGGAAVGRGEEGYAEVGGGAV